jgi:hypothetical protein
MQTRISSRCRLESLGDGGDESHVVGVEGHDGGLEDLGDGGVEDLDA